MKTEVWLPLFATALQPLINVKLSNGKFLVDGKKINSFTNSEEKGIGLDKVVPFALETALVKRGDKISELG